MSARDFLAREAESLLLEAGFADARADHFGPWWRVYGKLVNGDEHVGTTHLQADPQDPRDLARRLVEIAGGRAVVEAPAEAVIIEPVEEAHAEPVRVEPEPAAAPGAAGDSDAGQWEMGDGPSGDVVSAGDAGGGDDGGADADGGNVGSESAESGLALSGVEDVEAIDAEFVEEHLETSLIEEGPLDLGENGPDVLSMGEQIEPELIRIENDPEDIPVMEPEHGHPGGVVYFGDDIQVIKLAKMGRLAEIARALKDVLQEGWSIDEFRSLQNLIVRMDRGEAPSDPVAKARFEAISERSRAMARIDAFKDARELELSALDRAGIEAFDVDWGWPE